MAGDEVVSLKLSNRFGDLRAEATGTVNLLNHEGHVRTKSLRSTTVVSCANHEIASEIAMIFIVDEVASNVTQNDLESAHDGKSLRCSKMNIVHTKKDFVNRCVSHVRERRRLFLESVL